MIWVAAVAATAYLAPAPGSSAGLTSSLLPADSRFAAAKEEMARYFPAKSGLSQIAVVLERRGELTPRDLADAEELAKRLLQPRSEGASAAELRDVTVRSPRMLAAMGKRNPLLSADGQAAMVSMNLPYDQSTTHAVRIVDHVHAVVKEYLFEPGLTTGITGSAAYGRDYLKATEFSHHKIVGVTVVAIVLILLAVYRAPMAALIPLAGIGLATTLATKLLLMGHSLGLSSGTAERLFMLVLLFGAGVDYSVLVISRYREYLEQGRSERLALLLGLNSSLGAIIAAAATTAAGLSVLCFARFGIFRDVGPAIVLALVVAATASITVVPAMVAIVGPRVLWFGRGMAAPRRERLWPAVARVVTGRPGWVLLVSLIAAAAPALRGATLTWSYDAQGALKSTYDAAKGIQMVQRHWSVGEVSPVSVLLTADQPLTPATWRSAYAGIVGALRGIPGVGDVRGIGTPMGLKADAASGTLAALLRPDALDNEFISGDRMAMWLPVVLTNSPQSPQAMAAAESIRAAADRTLAERKLPIKVHLAGATAFTFDLREITQSDFQRTAAASLAIIFLVVLILLRDAILSAFTVAATVLGYLAALGLTYWIFTALGQGGLDWEVEVFLFIVMVAVGQDYNLFFAVRLAQETVELPLRPAAQQALVHTGRVISSCGVIMAAALGSMIVGDVKMLQQLGAALAVGMLIDTFVVRPLLLPAFILLTGRTLAHAAAFLRDARR